MSDRYLISGATGKTGAHVVALLRARGASVRALVHTRDERAQRLAELGAEVVEGDLLDFGAVSSAMAGVTAAYFCYPINPGLLEATTIFAQAAGEAGVAPSSTCPRSQPGGTPKVMLPSNTGSASGCSTAPR